MDAGDPLTRGDINKFWLGPFQSLCKECHDSTKKFVELHRFRPDIGLDGWPLDPRHPCYTGKVWEPPLWWSKRRRHWSSRGGWC
jgi:hypothetical protein